MLLCRSIALRGSNQSIPISRSLRTPRYSNTYNFVSQKSLQRRHLATKPPVSASSSSPATPSSPAAAKAAAQDAAKRQAQKTGGTGNGPKDVTDRILIYHAGTGRTTMIAMIKVTTLFISAFFCGIIVPSYVNSGKDILDTAQVALCGIIPPLFTTLTTAPFVTHIHAQLPAHAHSSPAALERFLAKPPGGNAAASSALRLTITTMSLIAKPRHSTVSLADLAPTRRRLGLVNYVRGDEAAGREDARRKWYMYRAVRQFYVQPGRPGEGAVRPRYEEKKRDRVVWWVWDAVKEQIDGRGTGRGA